MTAYTPILKASPIRKIMVTPTINVRHNGQDETKKVFKGWETILTAKDGREQAFYLAKNRTQAGEKLSKVLDAIRLNKISLTSYNAVAEEN